MSGTPSTAGADGRDVEAEEAFARVAEFLAGRGLTPEQIEQARADQVLHVLVADVTILPDGPRYTEAEVAERVHLPAELVGRMHRAMGFPSPDPAEVAYSDADLDALLTARAFLDFGLVEADSLVQLTRVIGSSMARIAEAEVAASMGFSPVMDDVERADLLVVTNESILPAVAKQLEYAWRRHLQAATRRSALTSTAELESAGHERSGSAAPVDPGVRHVAVGFADLVGFTAQAQQLSDAALASLVGRFESLAHDTVVQHGGRVVKMIGDEVLFVVADPAAAVLIAFELAEAYADDDLLSEVRIALAFGPVLHRDGDVFGPVVNMAHRMVKVARPSSIVVEGELHDRLVDDTRFWWRSLQRRYLKDIGRVALWNVRAADPEGETVVDHARRIGELALQLLIPDAALAARDADHDRPRVRRRRRWLEELS